MGEMKLSSVLALSAATSVLARVPDHLQQAPLVNEEKFLIELGPGETRWITEDEKWELRRNGINFMDISTTQDLGMSMRSRATVKYPHSVAHNKTVSALIPKLEKKNMRSNLETFTSFHTRYYKSQYGAQSSAWLLSQVQQILGASGAMKHGAKVKPFAHPWGQSSIIATIPGKSNKTVVIGAHQDSINLFLPSSKLYACFLRMKTPSLARHPTQSSSTGTPQKKADCSARRPSSRHTRRRVGMSKLCFSRT